MCLYELFADEGRRRRRIGRALTPRPDHSPCPFDLALADEARPHGRYGMRVGADTDDGAAPATYASAGVRHEGVLALRGRPP
ncbi:hypothetical protein ACFCZ1_20900 [Streptomyces sp. NPDC056224]|uniref:hypothetical protein n=1 Tax=Streptomyces sp. NPDC056224 TaxID=3345750 RepID=UPI0035D8DF5D